MKIITIDSCASTNAELKEMMATGPWMLSGTTLRAITQTAGRGQRGNSWEAEPGMNLTFSMVLRPGAVYPQDHFLLSEAIAVAIVTFLGELSGMESHDLKIKWPNDILADGKKIAGILIENTLGTGGMILHSIAGVGINVNQTLFVSDAPNPVSISDLTGDYYDLGKLQTQVSGYIEQFVDQIAPELAMTGGDRRHTLPIEKLYHSYLWRKTGLHRWLDVASGDVFEATLKKVASSGVLLLSEPDGRLRRYMFKEVQPV